MVDVEDFVCNFVKVGVKGYVIGVQCMVDDVVGVKVFGYVDGVDVIGIQVWVDGVKFQFLCGDGGVYIVCDVVMVGKDVFQFFGQQVVIGVVQFVDQFDWWCIGIVVVCVVGGYVVDVEEGVGQVGVFYCSYCFG